MEIHQIRAFLAVAEELHFGRAAQRLHMAQPPLSRTIRQLEREVGTSLFARTTRSVKLTAAGHALVQPAIEVLDSCEAASAAIRRVVQGEIGQVKLGFAGASSYRLVSTLARDLRANTPGIDLQLQSSTFTTDTLNGVVDGSLDLALTRWSAPPPRIRGRVVMQENPVALLPKEHRLAGRSAVTMNDLRDEKFVALPSDGSTMYDLTLHWAFEAGFTPDIVQHAPDPWVIGALVSAGVGISIIYDSVAESLGDPSLVAVPLDIVHEPMNIHLAWREDDANPALAEVLSAADRALPTVSA